MPGTFYHYPKLKIRCHESDSWIVPEDVGNHRYKATYDFPRNSSSQKAVYHFELYADGVATGLVTTVTVHPDPNAEASPRLVPSQITSYPTDVDCDGGPSSFFIHLKVEE